MCCCKDSRIVSRKIESLSYVYIIDLTLIETMNTSGPANLFHQPLSPEIIPGPFIRRLNHFVIEGDLGGQVLDVHLLIE